MRVIVECRYELRPPAHWSGPEPLPVGLSVDGESVEVEARLGTESEVELGPGGEPIETLFPVLQALVVRSGAALTENEVDRLIELLPSKRSVADGAAEPLKTALARNTSYARLVLRWLRVQARDALLDVTTVARGGKVTLMDGSGLVIKEWDESLSHILSFRNLRSEVGQDAIQEAVNRCLREDDLPLAVELLLEADALYRQFDYRLSVLLSALALDNGLTSFLRPWIRSEQAISTLITADSKALTQKQKEKLKKRYDAGGLHKARIWLHEWLLESTLGPLISAAEDLQLETNLEEGIFHEIREVKKLRDKIVHPRSSTAIRQDDANNARRLARRFLRLSGQLSTGLFLV